MSSFYRSLVICLACTAVAVSQPKGKTLAEIQEKTLASAEEEVVSLAEAMPADKYSFKPTQGAMEGVRTFGEQMTHIATVIYMFSAPLLGEKNPVETGKNENGAASLDSKEKIVKYLKDAFTYGRKATRGLTAENFMELVPVNDRKSPRGPTADISIWHTYDHYGQAAVYARLAGIVPPASRKK